MKKINKELADATFIPKAALIAYMNSSGNTFLETREIMENGMMGASKPLTYGFINSLINDYAASKNDMPYGEIPENLLYMDTKPGSFMMIWWNPPQKRNQSFLKGLSMKDGMYTMPGVVYKVKNDTLYIYAFKGKKPKKNSFLMKGPFFNYYDDCRVCLGSARCELPPKPKYTDIMKGWETLFWNSINSHTIGGAKTIKGNLTSILKEQKDKETFDTDLLVKTNIKIEDLWKK